METTPRFPSVRSLSLLSQVSRLGRSLNRFEPNFPSPHSSFPPPGYAHPSFVRGRPDLLHLVRPRRKSRVRTRSTPSSPDMDVDVEEDGVGTKG